jgi:hypothetical protein
MSLLPRTTLHSDSEQECLKKGRAGISQNVAWTKAVIGQKVVRGGLGLVRI